MTHAPHSDLAPAPAVIRRARIEVEPLTCAIGAELHGIHLGEDERVRLHTTGTALAHCPTSNAFLGSGLFDIGRSKSRKRPVRVGLATDIGAGTSFSMLRTMGAAYQTARLAGTDLTPAEALYLATRGAAEALGFGDRLGSLNLLGARHQHDSVRRSDGHIPLAGLPRPVPERPSKRVPARGAASETQAFGLEKIRQPGEVDAAVAYVP